MTKAERQRKYQRAHPERCAAAIRRWRDRQKNYLGPRRQGMVDRVMALKESNPCTDCGNKFPACCMDFDHVRGKKVASVSELLSRSAPWPHVGG